MPLGDAIDAFARAQMSVNAQPLAAETLRSYLDMVRRHHVKDDEMEKLALNLWNKHKEVLDFLVVRRPNRPKDILEQIKEKQEEIISMLNSKIGKWALHHETVNEIRYAYTPWDDLDGLKGGGGYTEPKRYVLFVIWRRDNNIIAEVYITPENGKYRDSLSNILKRQHIYKKKNFGSGWVSLGKKILFTKTSDDIEETTPPINSIIKTIISFFESSVKHLDPLIRDNSNDLSPSMAPSA